MCKKHESDLENYSIIYLQTNEEFLIDMKMSNGPKIICEKKKKKSETFFFLLFYEKFITRNLESIIMIHKRFLKNYEIREKKGISKYYSVRH